MLYHHERLDGTGYPTGLGGEAIPVTARVLSVVDAYNAMIHDRPHRVGRWPHEAVAELTIGAGVRFDPQVVRALAERSSPQPHRILSWPERSPPRSIPRAFRRCASSPGPTRSRYCRDTERFTRPPPTSSRTTRRRGHRAVGGSRHHQPQRRLAAGDHALLIAARATQLAASRVGGTVYRDSGRPSPSWSRASRPQAWQPNCTPSLPSVLASASDPPWVDPAKPQTMSSPAPARRSPTTRHDHPSHPPPAATRRSGPSRRGDPPDRAHRARRRGLRKVTCRWLLTTRPPSDTVTSRATCHIRAAGYLE